MSDILATEQDVVDLSLNLGSTSYPKKLCNYTSVFSVGGGGTSVSSGTTTYGTYQLVKLEHLVSSSQQIVYIYNHDAPVISYLIAYSGTYAFFDLEDPSYTTEEKDDCLEYWYSLCYTNIVTEGSLVKISDSEIKLGYDYEILIISTQEFSAPRIDMGEADVIYSFNDISGINYYAYYYVFTYTKTSYITIDVYA